MTPFHHLSLKQWKFFLICHAAAFFLLLSFFSPYTAPLWTSLDLHCFRFLNGSLKGHPSMQKFWALANHKGADWFEDVCILSFYTVAILKAAPQKRKERIFQLLLCVLITAATIILVNRLLCRDLLKLRRKNPAQMIPDAIQLAPLVPWISFKTHTSKSFPADHATTALMFAFSYAFFVRGKLAAAAILYGMFLCLPRLVVGAHWLSDVVVGSGTIVILSLSWALCSPFLRKPISIRLFPPVEIE